MQSYLDYQTVSDGNSELDIAAMTVLGDRADQQDCFGYFLREHEGLFVLCDGMGGYSGGKLASNTAVRTILSQYTAEIPPDAVIPYLHDTTIQANQAVCALHNADDADLHGGSTLVQILIQNGNLYWSSVGDSRAYLMRDNQLVQMTLDHNYGTVLDEQFRVGLISREQYEKEQANAGALISFLGMKNLELIDYNDAAVPLKKNDRIILMSDGLYKLVPDEDIRGVLSNFNSICDALQALEMKVGKSASKHGVPRDNMTVMLIQIKS